MPSQEELYQAILARRSVRRYDREPLHETTLAQVWEIVSGVKPLIPGNRFEALMRNVESGESLAEALGGYGRILTPPHYLVPYLAGERHLLTDLGYRVEQIAVRLVTLGLDSCYIGSLGRESKVRARFLLSDKARIGAFLVFGRPSAAPGSRAVNRLMRTVAGAAKKMPMNRIFFQETFAVPATPSLELAPLLEAARNAPSADNAQPWRFLWQSGRLHLFVTRNNWRYFGGPRREYCLYDGGICMANVALAMEASGLEGHWTMYEGIEPDIPSHPASLLPLARLVITGQR